MERESMENCNEMCKNETEKGFFFCVKEQSKGLTRAKQNNDSVEQHEMVISSDSLLTKMHMTLLVFFILFSLRLSLPRCADQRTKQNVFIATKHFT